MPFQRSTKHFCSDTCKKAWHRHLEKKARIKSARNVAQDAVLADLVAAGWLGEEMAGEFLELHSLQARAGAERFHRGRAKTDAAAHPKQAAAFLKMLQQLTLRVRKLADNRPAGVNTFSPEGKRFARWRLDEIIAEIEKLKLAL